MKLKFLRVCASFALIAMAGACTKSTPLQPSAGSTSGSAATSSTVPRLNSPSDGAPIPNLSQPLTLTIANSVSTSAAAPTYTFEVATDAGFATIVYSKAGVAQGADGQTSLTIDKLKPASTYYWRARVISGSTTGLAATPKTFVVGPDIILQAPSLASPAQNATIGTATLTVTNVQKSGPTGLISYQFDVADSSSFGKIVFAAKVNEGSGGQTAAAVTPTSLTSGSTYFWRVQATDASGVTSPVSSTGSFKFVSFDPFTATFLNNPAGVPGWAQTAKITSIEFTGDAMLVDFDKRTGAGRWPESGFGTGGIQYTLGMCFNLNGQWFCSAAIQFWEGRELEASGLPQYIYADWFYDARWGPMAGHQPQPGEQVAIFVAQGNLRDSGKSSVLERSDFVVMPFGGSYRP
jgi:hypothetical protein